VRRRGELDPARVVEQRDRCSVSELTAIPLRITCTPSDAAIETPSSNSSSPAQRRGSTAWRIVTWERRDSSNWRTMSRPVRAEVRQCTLRRSSPGS
jgi:hypothetical protein